MKKQIILMALLLVSVVSAVNYNYFDPRVNNWYDIRDWELDICQKYGGTDQSSTGSTVANGGTTATSANGFGTSSLSQGTITIQGRRQSYNIAGYNETLYEVSWYIESFTQESYTIELIDGTAQEVQSGTVTPPTLGSGSFADYVTGDFTSVKLAVGSQELTVPLVDMT